MREILRRKEPWTHKEVSRDEALEIFRDQKFKTELITDLPADEKITVYYTGDDYVDLCRACRQFAGTPECCLPDKVRLRRLLARR